MIDFSNQIPISSTQYVSLHGKYCGHCDKFFCEDLNTAQQKLNSYSKSLCYTLNYDFYIEPKLRKTNTDVKSCVYYFYLKEKDSNNSRKIIITSNKHEGSIEKDVYHYSDIISRTLLTSVYHFHKKQVVIENKNYRIIFSKPKNSDFISNRIIKTLCISKNGGLYLNSSNDEIVDVLLFSPVTSNYEILKASYNHEYDYCYSDLSLFKKFIIKYGNPGIPIEVSTCDSNGFISLKNESLLHAFGYSVSQKDNLTDQERHDIILDILGLNLMTPKEIILLLDFLINSHKNSKYDKAKLKWKKDMEFTMNYNTNTDNFLIVKL